MTERSRWPFIVGLAAAAGCTDDCGCSPAEESVEQASAAADPETPSELAFEAIDEPILAARLWSQPRPPYIAPSEERRVAVEALVEALVDQASRDRIDPVVLANLAEPAGFEVQLVIVAGLRYAIMIDRRASGAGCYTVRVGPKGAVSREVILQAPHAFFDRGSGEIALATFVAGASRVRALFVNTAHRYDDGSGGRDESEDNPADAAHNPEHLLSLATRAAAQSLEQVEVIQLHGFAAKRTIDGAPQAQAVVSAGDARQSSSRTIEIAGALRSLGIDAVRFPEETRSLGATQNVQGVILRTIPQTSFVHIEMSADLRAALRDDPAVLGSFARALIDDPESSNDAGHRGL
jgi:hypothetical protein